MPPRFRTFRAHTGYASDLPMDSPLRPQAFEQDGEEHVNAAGMLWLWYTLEEREIAGLKPAFAPLVRRFQERVKISLTAERLATGREPDVYRVIARVGNLDKMLRGADVSLTVALAGEGAS